MGTKPGERTESSNSQRPAQKGQLLSLGRKSAGDHQAISLSQYFPRLGKGNNQLSNVLAGIKSPRIQDVGSGNAVPAVKAPPRPFRIPQG